MKNPHCNLEPVVCLGRYCSAEGTAQAFYRDNILDPVESQITLQELLFYSLLFVKHLGKAQSEKLGQLI